MMRRGVLGPPPLRGSFFLENGTLRDTREKNPEMGSKNVTLHYSSESNTKMNLLGEKNYRVAHKLGMLVWEGDQKHLPPFIIQTREERGVECNRPAGYSSR